LEVFGRIMKKEHLVSDMNSLKTRQQLLNNNNNNKEGIQHTKAGLGQLLKKQHSNAWSVCYKYGELICEENTFLRLSRGDLKAETESEIRAAQDQAL
jgi:hypothetical protein